LEYKIAWSNFEQYEALARRVSAMNGCEYKIVRSNFEQCEALARRVSAMDGSE
jgi:hypothetical protein